MSESESINTYKYMESYAPFNLYHLQRIEETIDKALATHARITALRIDLHAPLLDPDNMKYDEVIFADTDSYVISRFIASLKAKIKACIKAKKKAGIRVHETTVHFVWVREFTSDSSRKHYHVLLLLNKDTFNYVGNFNEDKGTLLTFIHQAWMSALRLNYPDYRHLVHFPRKGCFYVYAKDGKSGEVYKNLIYASSYMAKVKTKFHGDNERNFGCSQ
ncbi:inovirus Gp2 family protein [Enterobacter sp. PTB]|uniref:inovirus Gp2 family protein n=1 Tax=Enterobacter sp. PTB TaxID=3143437 RepID=UPI003DA7CEC5